MSAAGKHAGLGDRPIEARHHRMMNTLAQTLDELFNGEATGADRQTGFVLMVFPFGNGEGRANYISNANRADIAGKRIILVDDSIVRGTTSIKIVEMMRNAGATAMSASLAAAYFGTRPGGVAFANGTPCILLAIF